MQLRGGPLIEIVEVTEPTAHLLIAAGLYGTGLQARRVVHPLSPRRRDAVQPGLRARP
jgi:hypothetical protein